MVRIVNDGDTGANLWASFYVFDDGQELTECCSCEISPDGVLSESVRNDLTWLTGFGRAKVPAWDSHFAHAFTQRFKAAGYVR